MKKKSGLQFAFVNLRVVIGLFLGLTGVFLALQGFSIAQAQEENDSPAPEPLVPAFFDCSRIPELGIDLQENLRAGAIMIACGEAEGGSLASPTDAVMHTLIPG